MSFLNELKRRNVLRVGAAYLVSSWLLIQIAETIFPLFGFDDTPARLVVIVLSIAFIPSLIFSWAFEITPEGLKRDGDVDRDQSITQVSGKKLDRIILVVLALALAYFAFDKFVLDPVEDEHIAQSAHQAGRAAAFTESYGDNSIAVLPFVNMSEDPDNEYFSDGLSEEILNLLARIPNLKVIGRTSSFAFKGKDEDLRAIGQQLGVQTLLEGSVRKSGERVRITAQLIDVSNGAQMWSKSYDRTMTDIFDIQDDVAAAIIDALQLHVGTAPTRGRPTESSEAYVLFLKARTLVDTHKGPEASKLLQQVTTLDPNFADAHQLQAFSYWTQSGVELPFEEGFSLMAKAATAALVIDPDLAFAQALSLLPAGGSTARLKALKQLERAWRENPVNRAPLRVLIYELQFAGYLHEAYEYAQQYVRHDPISPIANYSLGETLFSIGRTEEALAPLSFAYDMGEGFALWFVPAMHQILGDDELAITQIEADLVRLGINDIAWVRDLVEGGRDPNKGQAYLDRRLEEILATIPDEHHTYLRNVLELQYLNLGFHDRVYETIFSFGPNNQSQTEADPYVWLGTVLRQTGFTAHPRYLEVAELLGIPDIWEQRGPPDYCEKLDGQWVCE